MSDVYSKANWTSLRNFTDLVFYNITADAQFGAEEVIDYWKQPIIIAAFFGELYPSHDKRDLPSSVPCPSRSTDTRMTLCMNC